MLKDFFLFEVQYRINRPATYIYFFIFFLMTFFAVATDFVIIGGSAGRVFRNAPLMINNFVNVLTIFGIFVIAAVMGVPFYRDREFQTDTFFFTLPFRKQNYLAGRFLGAYTTLVFIFSSIFIAVFIGSMWPWTDNTRISPFSFVAYWTNFLWFLLPNLFFCSTIFFCLVSLTRNIIASYSGSAVLFVCYLVALSLSSNLNDRYLAALLDPFGLQATSLYTRYWTLSEQNVTPILLEGVILYNRLLWFSISVLLFIITMYQAKLTLTRESSKEKKKTDYRTVDYKEQARLPIPLTRKFYSFDLYLNQAFNMGLIDFLNIVKDKLFLSILFAGLVFLFIDGWYTDYFEGVFIHPVTSRLLSIKNGAFVFLAYAILIFYSGELVWKERTIKYAEILDALPIPNWLLYASKIIALSLVSLVLVSTIMFVGVTLQTIKGFTAYQPDLYFKELYLITFSDYLLFAFFCFFVHVIVNHKFLGFFICITFWICLGVFTTFGYGNPLYRYSALPQYTISQMNGYGHFAEWILWFTVYWGIFAILLTMLGNLFWPRGNETNLYNRLKIAKNRFRLPTIISLTVFGVLWVSCGLWIYYKTMGFQSYLSPSDLITKQAIYEKKYKQYEGIPQPVVTDVKINADFETDQRTLFINGSYQLQNKTTSSIDSIHLSLPSAVLISSVTIERQAAKKLLYDSLNGYYIFSFKNPLLPNESWNLGFDLEIAPTGFSTFGENQLILKNGGYVTDLFLPKLGYNPLKELNDKEERIKQGLAVRNSQSAKEDSVKLTENSLNSDAHWVNFSAIVSTTADQIALAPGKLQKEWVEDGYHYFQYQLEAPILKHFSLISGNYDVYRSKWENDTGRAVNLEIYHHPTHTYNLTSMEKAMQTTLDYGNRHLGIYPFTQLRIVEVPDYFPTVRPFPNTIPYNESKEFIMKVKNDEKTIDFPFYITARNAAKQWWGNQVIGANSQGNALFTETLPQYMALMVMEKHYGSEVMSLLIEHEQTQYFTRRANETGKEEALINATNQKYIYQHKGGLALYALHKYLGEKRFNNILREFFQKHTYQSNPYPTAVTLFEHIKYATPDSLHYLLQDWFKESTLYENTAQSGQFRALSNGKFEVELAIYCQKLYADSLGQEQEAPMNDLIEIGIYGVEKKGSKRKLLYLEKKWLRSGSHTLRFIVDEKPSEAGIDPRSLLLDPNPDDNMIDFDP